MSGGNSSKQLLKRQRIHETTLVIGMDIGYEFNAMVFMNKEGQILAKYPKIYNSRNGFNYFVKAVEGAKKKHGLKDVLIGMEPTGHYWKRIAYFGKDMGYEVRFVRTTALKHQRELDESSSAKSDIRDAQTIAHIVREGKYIDTIITDGIIRQLRALCKLREGILRYCIGSQHALMSVIDDYFPEMRKIFLYMNAKGLWAILEKCPFPKDVLKLEEREVAGIIAKASRRKLGAAQKARQLYQAAQESIGLVKTGRGDRYRLRMCLEEVKRSEEQLKKIEKQLESILKQIPSAKYILSIPGIGNISAAVFLGELGNPNYFKHPKQIIKYAGFDPQEMDSGQRISHRRISKKGRWLLRKYLYLMSVRIVYQSKFFKDYYQKKLEAKNRFGQSITKKEALCAVAIKLIKVIFALLRDKRAFRDDVPELRLAQVA